MAIFQWGGEYVNKKCDVRATQGCSCLMLMKDGELKMGSLRQQTDNCVCGASEEAVVVLSINELEDAS